MSKCKQSEKSCFLLFIYLAVILVAIVCHCSCTCNATSLDNNETAHTTSIKQTAAKDSNTNIHHVHKLMSTRDLRKTFQVDSHDLVPEYQVLQLIEDGSHVIVSSVASPALAQQSKVAEPNTSELNETKTNSKLSENDATLHRHHQRVKRSASGAPSDENSRTLHNVHTSSKPIVMQLETFGKSLKLRLRRNADFQQRVASMKVFIAESTPSGKLRYTEEHQHQHQHQQGNSSSSQPQLQSSELRNNAKLRNNSSSNAADKRQNSIGSAYHDEDNLAALLIDRDTATGQLLVDGTIGNDFVIKPLPASGELIAAAKTLFAPSAGHEQLVAAASGSASVAPVLTPAAPTLPAQVDDQKLKQQSEPSSELLVERAVHMHDDDPHNDDEMFLDEDEALELANARSLSLQRAEDFDVHLAPATNATHLDSSPKQTNLPHNSHVLSKLQAERKLRKHRKLLQQQNFVPKLVSAESQELSAQSSSHQQHQQQQQQQAQAQVQVQVQKQQVQRKKRQVSANDRDDHHLLDGDATAARPIRISHHVVYRLAASSESEHDSLPFGGQFLLEPGHELSSADSSWQLLRNVANSSNVAGQSRARRSLTSASGSSYGQQQQQASGRRRHKRQAPDTVWPEVLLVVDYDSFLLHGGDSREVKRYLVSFWNGVDLRYKLLAHPQIRISLAGMIVAKDRDATPYLERNRLRAPNADAVDAAGALTDMGKYLYREDRLPTYDLAVVITKLDMCRRRYEGGRCNRGTAGFAYVGGACVVNKRLEKVNSVAIIEDSGGFSGIIVAAHEVGHLLGCVHDGSPPPNYLGGPGATHCPWEDGFIMSDLRHTERGFKWSQCSVEQFKHFLK